MKNIVIVGGGTAGWMSALVMAREWIQQGVSIRVIESPDIGIIGVGEGSTPALKLFFDRLNIAESEWMPACNATYKCGIRFDGWSTHAGFESYFHPFSAALDRQTLPMFMHNAQMRLRGADVYAQPDRFFIAARLAQQCLAPVAPEHFPFDVHYGYHFDSTLLGQFLRKKALALGVIHESAHVVAVQQRENGDIASVQLADERIIAADFFVDCTGFSSLLLQQTLQVPFISYANNLLNNAAVAMPSVIGEKIPSQTLATAMSCGWAWQIPLTNRYGNGYVYSADFCSADQAETELRAHLGLLDADVPVRHLKMKIGRVEQHWAHNCLAVGLAQGFIEPLEATALFLVQQTVAIFAEYFARGEFTNRLQAEFNQRMNNHFDGVRDYIVTHYKTSSRRDTDYWCANTANQQDVSPVMLELYRSWYAGKDLAAEINRLQLGNYYPAPSWYSIFTGMGIVPKGEQLRRATAEEACFDIAAVDEFLRRCSLNFNDHRALLMRWQLSG